MNDGDVNVHDQHGQFHSLAMFFLRWVLVTSRAVVLHLQCAQSITQDANLEVQVAIHSPRGPDSEILGAHFEAHCSSASWSQLLGLYSTL